MTVQDLINKLNTLDPNLPVLIVDGLEKYDLRDYQTRAMELHEDYEDHRDTRHPEGETKKYAVIG